MAHVHAELMLQYAEDAQKHDQPWELWEYNDGRGWHACPSHPCWFSDHYYRRKRRAVKIAGHFVPEPCQTAPVRGQEYFIPNLTTANTARHTWCGDAVDLHALKSNLVHMDQWSETVHAKALVEVSKGWWK